MSWEVDGVRWLGLSVALVVVGLGLAGCGGAVRPGPTATVGATVTPAATVTPVAEEFLGEVERFVRADERLPGSAREAMMILYGGRPTFVFGENKGLVLQFNVFEVPADGLAMKKAAVLLMGTGVIEAQDYGLALEGMEVVFWASEERPWLALASVPPWDFNDLRLKPLAPEYIKQLLEAGVITPTPGMTY